MGLRRTRPIPSIQPRTERFNAQIGGFQAQSTRGRLRVPNWVIFDGDDTLWVTEFLYDEARSKAAAFVESVGISAPRWTQLQREIDIHNFDRFGLAAERFPTSCIDATERLASEEGILLTESDLDEVWLAACSVFERTAPVRSESAPLLRLIASNYGIALLTQGDPRVQWKRIEDSGLRPFFDSVFIVERKSEIVLEAVAGLLGAESVTVVGNSIRSDINPAIRVGLPALWLDTHVWEHEKEEVEASFGWQRLEKLSDAAQHLK